MSKQLTILTQRIYCLIDPITFDVMYVGKSGNPKRRYRHHVSPVINARYKGVKGDWIRYLLEFHNERPILAVLRECSEEDVDLWEHYYTKIFSGYPLVNTATILRETMQYALF